MCLINGHHNKRYVALDSWPTGREQNDDGQATTGQILLVLEILVGCNEDLEARLFSRCNEFTVLKLRPTLFVRGDDFMAQQRLAQRGRSTLVEEDFHSDNFEGASRRVLKDCSGLFRGDTWKPLDELVQRRIVF